MRVRMLGLVLTIIAAACDGGGPSGTPGSGFEGRYTGAHRFSFGGVSPDINCTGSVVIVDVRGTTLSGTLTIDPCPQLQSPNTVTTVISGTISSSGSMSFTIPGLEAFVEG